MQERTPESSHSFPAFPAVPAQFNNSAQLRKALQALEDALALNEPRGILLLLDEELMVTLSLVYIERLLQQNPQQHILWLVTPKRKAVCMKAWEHAFSWEDGSSLKDRFSITTLPQNARDAQVCIAAVSDIQLSVGVDPGHAFFQAFRAGIFFDVLAHPGPAWTHIMEIFLAQDKSVIGLSSTMSQEEGESFFNLVVDTKSKAEYKRKRA